MTLYWLVSLPTTTRHPDYIKEGDHGAALSNLRNVINSSDPQAALDLVNLNLPVLKVGTLDSLVLLSDELLKLDQSYESIVLKMADSLKTCLSQSTATQSTKDALKVNNRNVDDYLRSFTWNGMKYRPDRSIKEILEIIGNEMTGLDQLLKSKSTQYQAIRSSLISIERKKAGNLSVKSLSSIVGREHARVAGSDHLMTAFVAVPRDLYKDWNQSYETLTPWVVPRSSILVTEDSEFGLYGAVIFKKSLNDFTAACRENKFIHRDFEFTEESAEIDRQELARVERSEREIWQSFTQWLQASFGDAFQAWFHTKLLRAFTESVLRYGLPPDYVFALIKPRKEDKLEKSMNADYGYLAGSRAGIDSEEADGDIQNAATVHFADEDYSPYAKFTFEFDSGRADP